MILINMIFLPLFNEAGLLVMSIKPFYALIRILMLLHKK